MQPISGRIPDDLYDWLAATHIDGAVSMSDKLRVAVTSLKQEYEYQSDLQALSQRLREQANLQKNDVSKIAHELGRDSEVLNIIYAHIPEIWALIASANISDLAQAQKLEQLSVRKVFTLAETLLRQATTAQAEAFDQTVIRKQTDRLIELVQVIAHHAQHQSTETSSSKED